MRRKITFDLVQQEFIERGYELISAEYKNNSTQLEYICPKHKEKGILHITFANFTNGEGCPYCARRARRTPEEYIKDLFCINPNIEPIEDYKSLKTKILHKCKVCGYEWKAVPDNLLYLGYGCPNCSNHRKDITHNDFVEKLKFVAPNIKVLGEYTNSVKKIEFECLKCGNRWQAKPNNILQGKGCPKCKSSKGEKVVADFLDKVGIPYISQYCFKDCVNILPLPFDFYLPDKNICIEFDGNQHFKPCRFSGMSQEKAEHIFLLGKERDNIKTQYCAAHKIRLIRIPYWSINKIPQIISSIL